MERKRIEELYKILIKGLPLTKETLSLYNFNKEEIDTLITEEIIKKIELDKYTLVSVDDMYKYGVYLELSKQPKQSENCFRRCYKIEPTNRKVCMHLLLIELKRKNYIAVERLFPVLEEINKESHPEDNKLYQFLLGVILHYNKEYQEKIKDIEYDEILIPNPSKNKNIDKQNEIRMSVIKQKYPYATKQLNDLIRENITYNIEYELLKELLVHALRVNNKFKLKLQISALNKEYDNIITLLENKSKNQFLGNMETYILNTTQAILQTIKTDEIPEITCHNTTYMYEALLGNNFELARTINLEFIKKLNQNPKGDTLNILLNDILERISSIELSKYTENKTQHTSNEIEHSEEQTIKNTSNLTEEEELAYYIKESNIPVNEAIKTMGILPEQATIIKLIYARDYFLEGNYEKGNKFLEELETIKITSDKIQSMLREIKEIIISKNIKINTFIKTKN